MRTTHLIVEIDVLQVGHVDARRNVVAAKVRLTEEDKTSFARHVTHWRRRQNDAIVVVRDVIIGVS